MPPLGSSTVVCLEQTFVWSAIRCLPAVFPHFVTPARRRSFSIQSSHLLVCHPLDLFPVGFHSCTLLVSLLTFIHNTCPSHFNRICLLRIGHWYLLADRFICDAVFIRNPHNSSEPAIFTGIKPILHMFGEGP